MRHRGLFVSILLMLAWVPIPIGSNRGWSVAILEAVALSIFGIWAMSYALRPFPVPKPVGELRVSLLILAAWICFPVVQLATLPAWLAQLVSEQAYELYQYLPASESSVRFFLSVDREATLSGFLRQCALASVFFCVLAIAGSRERLRVLLIVLFAVGFIEALYGLIVYVGGGELGLWDPGHEAGTVSGTYVNQNHFAGLMELTIPVAMGLVIMSHEPYERGTGRRALLRWGFSMMSGQQGILHFGLLVMFGALILSTSRGAVGSLASALVIGVLIAASRRGAGARELRIGLTAVALVVLAVAWLGVGNLSSKLESTGLASDRAEIRELSYMMIDDSPIVGTGVGTYRWVLPRYKDDRFGSGFYEHAHNDYLEVLGEQGVFGLLLLSIALGLIGVKILGAYRRDQDPVIRGALFSAVVGCTSLLIHGLVDFNLQIPANALYFSTLLGVGAAAAVTGSETRS